MKVLAFLQNMWFREPEKIKAMMAENPARRNRYIKAFLFMGCLTGKRLQRAFGEQLCDEIIWEEISPEIGNHSSSKFKADYEHIQKAITQHEPDIILSFGSEARKVLMELSPAATVIYCPHPAARFTDVEKELRAGAIKLREVLYAKV